MKRKRQHEDKRVAVAAAPSTPLPSREQADRQGSRGGSAERSLFKRIFFPVLSVGLGLAAAVVLAEAMLRVFHIRPVRYGPPRWLVADGITFRECELSKPGQIKRTSPLRQLGVMMGEYIPGVVFKVAFATNPRGYFDQDNGVVMTVNTLGLRGEEISVKKPAGTYRILGLGDSFTFGVGVKDNDTFLHRLETGLNANPPGQERYEILNAGVQGYNTRDEVLYLEYRWLRLNPDLVLIVFYINDAYDDFTILNMGQGLGINRTQPPGLAQYSYLWDLAQHNYAAYRESKALEAYYHSQFFTNAETSLEQPAGARMDWTVCRAALERAAQICRERNVKLGLVMFPELYKLRSGYPFLGIHKLVRENCQRLGIPFLDLLDTFRPYPADTLWVHPSDHHPNEKAHALAAGAIEGFVRDQFLKAAQP